MTNLGMKIVGEELEAGFTVSSRAEFDEAVERLTVIAASLWPAPAAEPERTDLDEKYPLPGSSAEQDKYRNVAGRTRSERLGLEIEAWRESQGLR